MASESKVRRLEIADNESGVVHVLQDTGPLVQRYRDLFKQERFSDIVLRVGSHTYFAHRFILITASSVFEAMLSEQRWKEASQPEIVLLEEEECETEFEQFLGYLYSGEAVLKTMSVLPLLLLADKYEVSSLSSSCLRFMMDHIVQSPDTNRALTWYHYAQVTSQMDLEEKCLSFILSNFDTVMQASDWLHLELKELKEFLCSSEIVVHDEWTLWSNVLKWLSFHKEDEEDVAYNIRSVLPAIRFTMMPPKLLVQVEESALCQEHRPLFADKLNLAYRRHSLVMDSLDGPSGDAPSQLRQGLEEYRNYRSEDYSICHPFLLQNYTTANKIDTRISLDIRAQHKFVSLKRAAQEDHTLFSVYFFPRGHFTTLTLYGSYMSRQSDKVTLKVIRRRPDLEPMKVGVTLSLMGKQNGVRYVAFTRHWSVVFSKDNHTLSADSIVSLESLMEDNSPYLVDGSLEGMVFLKVQDSGQHLLEEETSP